MYYKWSDLVIFVLLPSDLSEPDEGVGQGALHHRGETDIVSHHHLIHGLHLKPAAVVVTFGSVDALRVPALQGAEGRGLQSHADWIQTNYRKSSPLLSKENFRFLLTFISAEFLHSFCCFSFVTVNVYILNYL